MNLVICCSLQRCFWSLKLLNAALFLLFTNLSEFSSKSSLKQQSQWAHCEFRQNKALGSSTDRRMDFEKKPQTNKRASPRS